VLKLCGKLKCVSDFECVLKKINREESYSCEINFDYGDLNSFTNFTHRHVPSGYSYIIIDKYGKVFRSNTYRGKGCVYQFFIELDKAYKDISTQYKLYPQLKMGATKTYSQSTATVNLRSEAQNRRFLAD